MSELIYEASVYSREISYRNFKGKTQTHTLYFALDPLKLLEVIADFKPKQVKSGNPAKNGKDADFSDGEQLKFVRDLAVKAAGFPSEDGETFEPFEDFENSIAGKAFLTKLTSSDGDRKEFAEKVILDPFRAFVKYASADETNSKPEIQQFQTMLQQMERLFAGVGKEESLEERRARLEAEMAALNGTTEAS